MLAVARGMACRDRIPAILRAMKASVQLIERRGLRRRRPAYVDIVTTRRAAGHGPGHGAGLERLRAAPLSEACAAARWVRRWLAAPFVQCGASLHLRRAPAAARQPIGGCPPAPDAVILEPSAPAPHPALSPIPPPRPHRARTRPRRHRSPCGVRQAASARARCASSAR